MSLKEIDLELLGKELKRMFKTILDAIGVEACNEIWEEVFNAS